MTEMTYAVLNPTTGEHTIVSTDEDALALFVGRVLALALPFFGNVPFMIVTQTDDGEVWAHPDDNVIDRATDDVTEIATGIAEGRKIMVKPELVSGAFDTAVTVQGDSSHEREA